MIRISHNFVYFLMKPSVIGRGTMFSFTCSCICRFKRVTCFFKSIIRSSRDLSSAASWKQSCGSSPTCRPGNMVSVRVRSKHERLGWVLLPPPVARKQPERNCIVCEPFLAYEPPASVCAAKGKRQDVDVLSDCDFLLNEKCIVSRFEDKMLREAYGRQLQQSIGTKQVLAPEAATP